MKTILIFDLPAKARRAVVKEFGNLTTFSNRTYTIVARDDAQAVEIIRTIHQLSKISIRFLVIDANEFAKSWGVCMKSIAFGGPFDI